jgi:uncharacterized SAM-binding protein YcdF (DUF218 family)
MMDLLKGMLLPSGIATLLMLAGLIAIVFPTTRRFALRSLSVAAAVVLIFSNGIVATLLLSPLEYAFPALQDPRQFAQAQYIVLLTGYGANDPNMPLSGRMNGASAFRVLEAANVRSRRPDCKVIVSGSAAAARVMGDQLLQLGVPKDQLFIDIMSNDTSESARHLESMVQGTPLFLVTSAGHMTRAVGVFRKLGMTPIPAPTDYRLPMSAWHASWTNSPIHLEASDLAIHEYIGLAWYRLMDRL